MFHDRFASALATVAVAAILLPSSLMAQITFQRTYGGPHDDEGWSVQQTFDGGYIVTGWTGAWPADVYLVKTDAGGDTLWTRAYGGTNDDGGLSVRQTFDGGYVVAGFTYSYGAGGDDLYLVRTDANGNAEWTKTYGGPGDDAGFSVQQTTDGGFIASGFGDGDWEEAYLVKTNALGDTQWTRMFPGMNWDGTSVQQTADGGYIVTGTTGAYAYLIKYDAAGDTQWTRRYGRGFSSYGLSVRQTFDGGYVVVGRERSGAGDYDVLFFRTNADGDTLWTKTFGGADDDKGWSVQQTADSGYVFAGYTRSLGSGGSDVYVVRTDASGDVLWTRTFGGPGNDGAYEAQQTADGGYVIAGFTRSLGAGEADIWLIKTDSLGNVGVEEPQASPAHAQALSLTCEPNPCRGATTVRLPPSAYRHAPLTLRVFDAQGRAVRTLTVGNEPYTAWDGTDELGQPLPSGAYFVRGDIGNEHATTRVVLQR